MTLLLRSRTLANNISALIRLGCKYFTGYIIPISNGSNVTKHALKLCSESSANGSLNKERWCLYTSILKLWRNQSDVIAYFLYFIQIRKQRIQRTYSPNIEVVNMSLNFKLCIHYTVLVVSSTTLMCLILSRKSWKQNTLCFMLLC